VAAIGEHGRGLKIIDAVADNLQLTGNQRHGTTVHFEKTLEWLPGAARQRQRVAVVDAGVRRVEQLEADQVLVDAGLEQRAAEGRRADVEVEVVPGPGVDPDT